MGSIDWAAVIAAAAASSLGVLSLIVLVIAFLAFIFFRGSRDRIKVGVFAAVLAAGIGFGVAILREGLPDATRSAANRASDPAGQAEKDPAGVPPVPVSTESEAAPDAAPAQPGQDISGTWRDDDGYTYAFKAKGPTIAYEQIMAGKHAGSGSGTIVGRTLRYDYVDDRTLDRGSCTGMLATDGAKIEGQCGNGKHRWGFTIFR